MKELLSYKDYELVFEDHFDAAELDRSRWNVELHEPGWVNQEWQEYVDSEDTIHLEDSKLLIRPIKTCQKDVFPPRTSVILLMACSRPVCGSPRVRAFFRHSG